MTSKFDLHKTEDWRLFQRVISLNSMNKASVELGINIATVSQKIRSLEEQTGLVLLERSHNGTLLTPDGVRLLSYVERKIAEFDTTIDRLLARRSNAKCRLSVSAPGELMRVIIRCQKDLIAVNPDIEIELVDNEYRENRHTRVFDLRIFANSINRGSMCVSDLGTESTFLFASPQYLKEHSVIRTPQDLESHRLLLCSNWTCAQPFVYQSNTHSIEPISGRAYSWFVNNHSVCDAAIAGLGVAWGLSGLCCEEELERGRLVRVLPEYEGTGIRYFAESTCSMAYEVKNRLVDDLLSRIREVLRPRSSQAPTNALY